VNNCMTVWANRDQINNRIDNVRLANFADWFDVMYLDQSFSDRTINIT